MAIKTLLEALEDRSFRLPYGPEIRSAGKSACYPGLWASL
jgi:hypothetical protein